MKNIALSVQGKGRSFGYNEHFKNLVMLEESMRSGATEHYKKTGLTYMDVPEIVGITGVFDNHVWPKESCRLEGAKNIQVQAYGHDAILFDKRVRDIVSSEVENS